MQHEFVNQTPVFIDPGAPGTVTSAIEVAGTGGGAVAELEVRLDLTHSWTGDLVLTLVGPDGTEAVLVTREGGSGDDFQNTIFRDAAQNPIGDGTSPFRGTFRPETALSAFDGLPAEGTWTLRVEDRAHQDGGALNRWALSLATDRAAPSPFRIDLRFLGGLTTTQQAAIVTAAARVETVIRSELPPAVVDGEVVDDLLIEARGVAIDGVNGTLGAAGPTALRPGSLLPAKGIMSFDTADLARLEERGDLDAVMQHEILHVIGFGTLWQPLQLLQGAGEIDPRFIGANAMREYGALLAGPGTGGTPTPVPVANTGGPGTRDGHWREAVFGDELVTGFLSGTERPLSAMSIGSFEDLGYTVDYSAADPYELPTMFAIAALGLLGDRHAADTCCVTRPTAVVLPPAAMAHARA